MTRAKDTNGIISWQQLSTAFLSRCSFDTKEIKFTSGQYVLRLVKVRKDDDGEYSAKDKLTNRIDQLAPMGNIEDQDDAAKAHF